MSVFLSLVGQQPSATAVALKTWADIDGPPAQAVLLATPEVKTAADRLESAFPGISFSIPPIGNSLQEKEGRPSPAQVLDKLDPREQIVFHADPGMKFQVVSIARELPEDAIFLHCDAAELHAVRFSGSARSVASHPLQNIGLKMLLNLYGLGLSKVRGASPVVEKSLAALGIGPLPDGIQKGVRIEGPHSLTLDLAYERRGRLYGLVTVLDKDRWDETKDKLQVSREIQSVQLNGLKPFLTILSPYPEVINRLRSSGHETIDVTHPDYLKLIKNWINRRATIPGRSTAVYTKPIPEAPETVNGQGGKGSAMAVCVGLDPSATLVSLCTHKPKRSLLFYDAATPAIVEMAKRIGAHAGMLPVGTLEFLPTDHLGKGISEALADELSKTGTLVVNITPGTKAQGCVMSRVPGVSIWSLRSGSGKAVSLDDETKTLGLVAPDLLTQCSIIGGKILDQGLSQSELRKKGKLLNLLAKFLECWVKENPDFQRSLTWGPAVRCSKGKIFINNSTIRAEFEGQVLTETFPRNIRLDGGFWFELVVARAFLSSGPDEVRVGVKLDWPPGVVNLRVDEYGLPTSQRAPHKDEIDILMRFGHRYVAVECKAGMRVSEPEALRSIEARTQFGIGRFGLPILVRPIVDVSLMEKSLKASRGAALLDMNSILDPVSLRQKLKAIFRARSTTADMVEN